MKTIKEGKLRCFGRSEKGNIAFGKKEYKGNGM